jgi:Bifunctional DNA primase/polymerase, N-terminal
MSDRHIGYFNTHAGSLVENGFTVTPTNGKAPVVRRWQNQAPTNSGWLSKMLKANHYSGYNIGIVCGRVVGIDIDADEPAKAAELEALAAEHLGSTPFKRIGRPTRSLLLYRPAENESIPSTKIGDCVEVLSGGRQFVAYGIHPDIEEPYRWTSSRHNPATARLEELPVITASSVQAFAEAVCTTLGRPLNGHPGPNLWTVDVARKTRQRTRQGDMLGTYDARIVRDADGRVADGREAFMAKLLAAEYAKGTHTSPDDLGCRVWARFVEEADLSRPMGSNPRRRWVLKDALSKARAICRKKPDLKPPRRSRGGHPASHLHAYRKPGLWKAAQRDLHMAEAGRRIATPVTLAVERVMIEAVDLATGFCSMPIAEIAKRACCAARSVTKARKALNKSGLWIAGPRGVFVPVALNRNQVVENKGRKAVGGNIKVPSLYHLCVVAGPPLASGHLPTRPSRQPYQPDLFGASVVDLDQYRRGLVPSDLAAAVRAEMRARGVTQDELAVDLGISQPQLANALAGRFGLSPEPAARLLVWLRKAA